MEQVLWILVPTRKEFMQFETEVKQTVSRLRAIEGIVILDDQIVTQVLMSLPPSLKLNFGVV
jgi:hypothetical protein